MQQAEEEVDFLPPLLPAQDLSYMNNSFDAETSATAAAFNRYSKWQVSLAYGATELT